MAIVKVVRNTAIPKTPGGEAKLEVDRSQESLYVDRERQRQDHAHNSVMIGSALVVYYFTQIDISPATESIPIPIPLQLHYHTNNYLHTSLHVPIHLF